MYITSTDDEVTYLDYDSARAPNNGTLERLHELTGWHIENEYEEPGCAFEGTFFCLDGGCSNEEREYCPRCEVCDRKRDHTDFTLDEERCCCDTCWTTKPDTTS